MMHSSDDEHYTNDLIFTPPTLVVENPDWAEVAVVYADAVANLTTINTVWHKGDHVFRAGQDYERPWTRDATLNCMMAGSLLSPGIAENTLRHVLDGDVVGGQWWDRVIWCAGALEHWRITGDQAFLEDAYRVASVTLVNHRKEYFDTEYGLFRGLAHMQDGIAGYPAPPQDDPFQKGKHSAQAFPGCHALMALSIQAVYFAAYQATATMGQVLGRPQEELNALRQYAEALRAATTEHLWMPEEGRFGYFVHGVGAERGELTPHQDGSGLALSLLFGLTTAEQGQSILTHFHNQPYGLPLVWPHFRRFNDEKPGRHNVLIWPHTNAYWALGALVCGVSEVFDWEFQNITELLYGTHPDIRETYDSITGQPEGGWQGGTRWEALHHQTWCATGYLGLVFCGLFGLRFEPEGIRFCPYLPKTVGPLQLKGLHYRDMVLDISLRGQGKQLNGCRLDGKESLPSLPATLTGHHEVVLTLEANPAA